MYEAEADPYCYPGTTVLINRPGLRNHTALSAFEAEMVSQRFREPLPREHIEREMQRLFAGLAAQKQFRGLNSTDFAVRAAHFLAELNAIHPFREGNGRTQLSFLVALAHRAEHLLDADRLEPAEMLRAMVQSFSGNEQPLAASIRRFMASG